MRAPVLVFPRTRPPQQGRSYLDAGAAGSPEAFGLGVAKGANSLGGGLVDLAVQQQQRNDQVSRFKALTDLTVFETQAHVQQGELKRTAPADVTDFPKTSTEAFDKAAEDFIKAKGITDPALLAEVRGKLAGIKQGITADSYDFQYKQQDALFVSGLNQTVQTWRNRIYADPSLLPKAKQDVIEKVKATDLPPDKQIEALTLFRQDLEDAAFGAGAVEISRKDVTSGPTPGYSEGAQSITDKLVARGGLTYEQAAVVAGNMQQESGFRTWAHNTEEGAHGLIQWRLSRWDKMQAAAGTAGKDWRDPNFQVDFFLKEFKQDYPRAWNKFVTATSPEEMQAALKQYIGYKDDGGANSAQRLANAGAILKGANPQADLSKTDSTRVADLAALNSNPDYASVPLERRLAAINAADSQAGQEAHDAALTTKAAVDAKLNALFVGLNDGTKDANDVMVARNEGWLSNFEDIARTDQIMGARQAGLADAAAIQATVDNGGQGYNRVTMNGEKNKGVNAWVGEQGLGQITAMNDEYMNKTLLPAVRGWDDIPTVVVGQLDSMVSSNDTTQAVWALQQLQNMKDVAPNGFVSRTNGPLNGKVEAFRNLRGFYKTNEEMLSYVNGGTTPEAQRVMQVRDEQAKKNINKIGDAKFLLKVAPSGWGWPRLLGGYGSSALSQDVEVTGPLALAARDLYIENFRLTGDNNKALSMTARMLDETWGLSTVADSKAKVPMEWPPEKLYAGTKVPMEEYANQVRRDLNLTSEENYRLISDDTTYREKELAAQGQLVDAQGQPKLPTYKVIKIDKNANPIPMGRWGGDPTPPPAAEGE